MKTFFATLLIWLYCSLSLQAQPIKPGLYVGQGALVKIGANDTLMIKGDLINSNTTGYLTIYNAGHIFLSGDLEDQGKGLFQSSSFSNEDANEMDTVLSTGLPGTKKPRGYIYFVGDSMQSISSVLDTSIWLANVYVYNAVKLQKSVRVLGVLTLYDSLDINGNDIYHYVFDNFDYEGNWGKLANETNSTFVYDSDTNKMGGIRMLKLKANFDDLSTIGLTIETNESNAKISVVRRHAQDKGVTSGTIRKYFDVLKSDKLPTDSRLSIAYFDRDFNTSETSEDDFSLFEIRTDAVLPKARRLQSNLDTAVNVITSNDSITYTPRKTRYSVASTRCSDAPYIDLGADTVLCAGNALTLKAAVTQHLPAWYEWKHDTVILKTKTADSTLLLREAGKYYVRVTDSRGCESIDSINVHIAPNPQPVIRTNAPSQCESSPFTFWYVDTSLVTVEQVQWKFGDNTFAFDSLCTKSYEPLCGTYPVILTVTSTDGCVASDSLPVTVEQRRQPTIRMESLYDTNGTFVVVDTLQDCPSVILGITWYINNDAVSTEHSLSYHFPDYGDYLVGVRLDGNLCSAYTQETIHIRAPGIPQFSIPKQNYCVGEPVNIVNTSEVNIGGFAYYWNYGNGKMSQDSIPAITYADAGSYIISLTMVSNSIAGWQHTYSDTIHVHDNPHIDFGGSIFHCKAQYTLQPEERQSYYTYEWKWEETTIGSGETLIATADGKYSLTVTNILYGCQSAEEVHLSLNNPLQPQLGEDREACGYLVLDAHNPNAEYLWNTGAITREITVNESGAYHVYVRDAEGCEGRDTVHVVIYEMPVASLGDDVFLCDNETMTLQIPANAVGSSYWWNTGATTETIIAASAGIYSVRIIHANGICVATDTIQIFTKSAPVITFEGDKYICNQQPITLNQNNLYYADEIRWTYPNGQTTTGIEISTNQNGIHQVYVRNTNGCTATGSVVVHAGETNSIANFMVSSKNNLNDVLQFVNLSYPEPLSYQWEVENRLFSTEENPQLTLYAGATWMTKDTFNVRLTVSDGACPVSKVKQIVILPETAGIKLFDMETDEETMINSQTAMPNTNYVDVLDAAIYPNPTSTGRFTVTVNLTAPENLRIVIFNISGHIMERKIANAADYFQIHFNTYNYSSGIYLVHLSAGEKTRLLKVIIE
jgi:PKD repeat protein